MNDWSRYLFPGSVVGFASLYLLMAMTSSELPPGKMRLDEFASLSVVEKGRIKPIDTVARTKLLLISNRQTFTDQDDEKRPALLWLLDVMVNELPPRGKGPAWDHKVFRIENGQVLDLLDLPNRPGSWRYSLAEIAPNWKKLTKEALRADDLDPKQRTLFDQKVLELSQHLLIYRKLAEWKGPLIIPSRSDDKEWHSYDEIIKESVRVGELLVRDEEGANELNDEQMRRRVAIEARRYMATYYPAAEAWSRLLRTYRDNQPEEFNKAVADFRKHQGELPPSAESKAKFEVFFNSFAPFYRCSVLYVLVFLLGVGAWIGYSEQLNRAAFWLAILVLAVHSAALLGRMWIQGRPPVTNLYSSAVFIGWGSVGLGLFLNWIYRNGIGTVVAAVTGGLTGMVAHHLATTGGDTMEMMRAVLDTNFWLATHVVCITFGYAATFFAGFLATFYIVLGVFTPYLQKTVRQTNPVLQRKLLGPGASLMKEEKLGVALSKMIYGVLCFALFLSFVGTVLGGIWADQSWGRFWGWDPKENGALLIVLMNALILHARWAGMVKQRGMAVLAIVGNMVTGWSWFGTNQLGVGLHAYGFNNTLATGLSIFWGTQLALIGLGLLPPRLWQSFGTVTPKLGPPPVVKGKGKGRRGPKWQPRPGEA